jgi:hypothetical protein
MVISDEVITMQHFGTEWEALEEREGTGWFGTVEEQYLRIW